MLEKRDGISPDLMFKNRIGEVTHDEEEVDLDLDLIAGVDDDDTETNQADTNQIKDPPNFDDTDDLVEIENENDAVFPGVDDEIPGVDDDPADELEQEEINPNQLPAQLRRST